MQRVEIIVKGKVQKVGYRDFVQDTARECEVVGFVENQKDGNVYLIAEAKKEILEKFIKKIKVKKDFIDVSDVLVDYREATREFKIFEIKYGSVAEELTEVMGPVILYLGDTNRRIDEGRTENKEGFRILADKQDQMLDKQDQMLDKQDQTIESINMGFAKTDGNFNRMDTKYDRMSDKMDLIDNTLKELTKAILKMVEATSARSH